MRDKVSIRRILPSEYFLTEDIMYEGIYYPDPVNPYPKDVIYLPQVRIYWDNGGELCPEQASVYQRQLYVR